MAPILGAVGMDYEEVHEDGQCMMDFLPPDVA